MKRSTDTNILTRLAIIAGISVIGGIFLGIFVGFFDPCGKEPSYGDGCPDGWWTYLSWFSLFCIVAGIGLLLTIDGVLKDRR